MAKKKLPKILKAWQVCRDQEGAKPFKKMSPSLKSKVKSCVSRFMR